MRFQVRESSGALASGRGRIPLVLDQDLLSLKGPLEKRGFNTLTPKAHKPDAEIMTEDLPGRIFVTNSPKDFIYSASLLDYSLADMIGRAWVDYSLKAEHPAFYLVLRQNGRHEISTDL